MSVRMRHTHGHTRNRRSHHALGEPRLSRCEKCGSLHLHHRMCDTCGTYRGRQVVNMEAKAAKKMERTQRKSQSRGIVPNKDNDQSTETKGEKETK